jgi:hypothetical protein
MINVCCDLFVSFIAYPKLFQSTLDPILSGQREMDMIVKGR